MTNVLATTLIPRQVLFGNPSRTQLKVAPDGSRLAFIAPVDGVLNVWVGDADAESDSFSPVTNDANRGIRTFFWSQSSDEILYLQDVGGDENWRLYSVRLSDGEVRDLTPFENVTVRVLDVSKRFPTRLLLAINKDNVRAHDVYSLDLISGELSKIVQNPGDQVGWGVDINQTVRTATVMLPDGGSVLKIRATAEPESEWSDLISWEPDDALSSNIAGFTADSQSIYLIDSTGFNAGRLVKRSLIDQTVEVLLEDDLYDVAGAIMDIDTWEVQAAAVVREKTEWSYFDPEFESEMKFVQTSLSGEVSLVDRDNADNVWILSVTSDIRSAQFFVFNRTTRQIRLLFSVRPELDNYSLYEMKPVTFTSRDGLTVRGYLTLPGGVEKRNLPLVLNVHGGPWARDRWGLNPEVQWLADRGYAVLQINYRGSTGYGKTFLNAGNKEWGGRMHDDLVDAVQWITESGVADKNKVAIYGGSYGGYAALVGATFTPDLFCCAVDIVGVSNLLTFINSIPPYWSAMLSILHKRVGDPETEEEFLKSRSPLFKVDEIKIPMLIAQGANDPRVKQAESEQIVAAMAAKELDYKYLLFPDEGHGFARPENRLRFYAEAEEFLAQHLGGQFEPG